MKIRRIVADTFQEAVTRAKNEMGKDAIILHSRKFKEGGVLGLFARQKVEITVAADEEVKVRRTPRTAEPELRTEMSHSLAPAPTSLPESTLSQGTAQPMIDSSTAEKLLNEIQTIREAMEEFKQQAPESEKLKTRTRIGQALLKNLISREVGEKLAHKIVSIVEDRMDDENIKDMETAEEIALETIVKFLKKVKPIDIKGKKARVIALVGPTGVGKTTTIAKLAANFSLLENRKVSLITLDTYRIAAVEQLKTYAEIIGMPLEVVFNPEDLKKALRSFQNKDLILIDTAGRSPHNKTQMNELKQFLEVAQPDETILVLSATTRTDDLLQTFKQFSLIKIDKLIFTKLDETSSYGQILTVVHNTKSSLSYITNGQNVPDDIALPNEEWLAKLILGEVKI